MVHAPAFLVRWAVWLAGKGLRDVVLTREEMRGLMEGTPTGKRRLSECLEENREEVGREYASELLRNYRGR